MNHEPKISIPTGIFIGIICLLADIIDLFTLGFPVGDIIAFPITQIYLRIKGLRGEVMLAGNLLELGLGVVEMDWLPIRTVVWIYVVWVDHNPKSKAAEMMAVAAKYIPKKGAPASPTARKVTARGEGASAEKTPAGAGPTAEAGGERETKYGGRIKRHRAGVADDTGEGELGADEDEDEFGLPEEPIEQLEREILKEIPGTISASNTNKGGDEEESGRKNRTIDLRSKQ